MNVAQSAKSDMRWKRAKGASADLKTRRSSRLSARLINQPLPRFDDLAMIPQWTLANVDRNKLAFTAALLHHRPLIDREISGQRLGILAEYVGEDIFDQICAADLSAELLCKSDIALPPPEHLSGNGEALIQLSMPGPDQQNHAFTLINMAASLLGQSGE